MSLKEDLLKNKLPVEFVNNMKCILKGDRLESFLNSFNEYPTSGIIINKNKINNNILNDLSNLLELEQIDKFTYKINNIDYISKIEKIGKSIYHHAGCFYVSEPSAMKVIPLLVC